MSWFIATQKARTFTSINLAIASILSAWSATDKLLSFKLDKIKYLSLIWKITPSPSMITNSCSKRATNLKYRLSQTLDTCALSNSVDTMTIDSSWPTIRILYRLVASQSPSTSHKITIGPTSTYLRRATITPSISGSNQDMTTSSNSRLSI